MLKYCTLIILVFYGCNPIISPEINDEPGDFEPEYLINIQGLNTGSYFNLCTLQWSQYSKDDFQSYRIRNKVETLATINNSQTTSFEKELDAETFEKIYIDIISESTITDSIEIYTRPIKPITNLSAVANADNWFSTLTWTPSQEINSSFEKYSIYRSDITPDNFILINEAMDQTDSSYVDTITTWGYEYYYKIQTHTTEGYSRRSIIQSNILNNITNYGITLNTTNDEYNKVTLSWEHDLDEEEFYAIEIWRTDIQSTDPLDDYLLATITDHNKNQLEDSYLIGNGVSWFYKLKLIDQFGNISYSSIIAGNSHP